MESFKQASKQKLRVQTNKGLLSTEQLWDLSLSDLDNLAVSLEEAYNNSKGKSFLTKKTVKDKDIKLQFDVVYEILQSKVEDNNALLEAKDRKEHNAKIDALIAEKQDEELKGLSVKQLEKMRK